MGPELAPERLRWWWEPLRARRRAAIEIGKEGCHVVLGGPWHPRAKRASHAELPDDMFEHDGQLTKRDLRAAALARPMPAPGQLRWDVGAGAGSVGIEWMRAHPTCRAVAVEADGVRADRIGCNARTLGVPGLEIVHGSAPEALDGLPAPDA